MIKLLIIIGITAYFAYTVGKRLGENKALNKEDKPNDDEANIIDAEIIEDDEK